MAYLIVTDSKNGVLILGTLSMLGIPGISAILAIMSGQQPQPVQERTNSRRGIESEQSQSPQSHSSSS